MRIGPKILISLVVPIVVVIAVFGYIDQRRSRALLKSELLREGRAIARVAQLAVEDALRDRQLGDMRELVDQITGYERVYGVRIFDRNGELVYESSVLSAHPFMHHNELMTVLKTRTSIETHRVIAAEPVVTYIVPLMSEKERVVGAIQVLQLESFIEEDARAARNFTILMTGVLVVIVSILVFIVTDLAVRRPVEDLVQSFQGLEADKLASARIPVHRHDEIGRLADEFNSMVSRLDHAQHALSREQSNLLAAESRLRRAEHLAALGRLAAGLAHEIGTPLGVIKGRAESLMRGLPEGDPSRANLQIIVSQIDRITRTLRATLDFARAPLEPLEAVNVGDVLEDVVDLLSDRLRGNRVEVAVSVPRDLPHVNGNTDRLTQVFLNLAVNAIDAMPRGGLLRIGCESVARIHPDGGAERAFVCVTVADTGAGIPAENLEKVFEPFFTTKDVGQGSGLGLSISYGISQEHGGWIEVTSEKDRGTVFTVSIPCVVPHSRNIDDEAQSS